MNKKPNFLIGYGERLTSEVEVDRGGKTPAPIRKTRATTPAAASTSRFARTIASGRMMEAFMQKQRAFFARLILIRKKNSATTHTSGKR